MERLSRLRLIKEKVKKLQYWWYGLYECSCGTRKLILNHNVIRGLSKSCGCLKLDTLVKRNETHKLSDTAEYTIWNAMRQRCENPKQKAYKNYGGRGIEVCKRWLKFENFYADMGPRPSRKYSIDRIYNDGNYEPGNCRWATASDQQRNKRPRRKKEK